MILLRSMSRVPATVCLAAVAGAECGSPTFAQTQAATPSIRAGVLSPGLVVDGVVDDTAWTTAESIESFTQSEPNEGAPATFLTAIRVIWNGAWNPAPLVTIEFSGERHVGRLATGRFTQTQLGSRLRINVSPDLSLASYVQYDTDSRSLGTNTRLRWTFLPVADLFVVYNHNVRSLLERWQLESNQLLVKLQYAWRL